MPEGWNIVEQQFNLAANQWHVIVTNGNVRLMSFAQNLDKALQDLRDHIWKYYGH